MSRKRELGNTVDAKAVDRQAALAAFERELGSSGVIADIADMVRYLHDWAGDYEGRSLAILRPASVAEMQVIVRICRTQRLVIVPQGGNTGLVNGAFGDLPRNGVIVSTERMNAIRSIDEIGFTIQVDAGCTLQQVKDAAEEQGFLFPLALGAQGSCQIGGNAATNAGGINVLRYGMARDLILGLEVVLPDAEIWNGMSGLRKDNRGYDLDQLFIGAEGTLGIVTGVELKLFPRHARTETAYLGLASFNDALILLSMARRTCSDLVSAFEVIGRECIGMARLINPSLIIPVAEDHPVHIVLECASSEAVDLRAMMESLLGDAIEAGLVADAALAESVAQARAFWAIREGLVEGQSRRGYHVRTDMSVRLRNIPVLIDRAHAFVAADHAAWQALAYGHAGDGNIHFNALPPVGMKEADARAEGQLIVSGLHAIVEQLDGSISAEHGIGRTRRDAFWASLSPVHKQLVSSIKLAIDPDDIMNPGCLLPTGDERR